MQIFSGNFKKMQIFRAKIVHLQLLLSKLFYLSSKVTTFEHASSTWQGIIFLRPSVTTCQPHEPLPNIWGSRPPKPGSFHVVYMLFVTRPGLLVAVAPRYRYCSGATFTVAVAVAPLLLAESSGDGSAATFLATFQRYSLPLLLKKRTIFSTAHFSESGFQPTQ